MSTVTSSTFNDVLEAVDRLAIEDQEKLIEIVRKRLAAQRRDELVASVLDAEREFEGGKYRVSTVDEIMNEALS